MNKPKPSCKTRGFPYAPTASVTASASATRCSLANPPPNTTREGRVPRNAGMSTNIQSGLSGSWNKKGNGIMASPKTYLAKLGSRLADKAGTSRKPDPAEEKIAPELGEVRFWRCHY